MTVYVFPKRWDGGPGKQGPVPVYDVTTRGPEPWQCLSPMLLGPVMLYAGQWSRTVENAWQYSKIYPEHQFEPGAYWNWAQSGWANPRAVRYPMGKGAMPAYSLWAGEELDYVTARRRIYMPLYAQAVRFYQVALLQALRDAAAREDIVIADFDAYDHRALGYSWDDVINDPDRKMGHGFVLAMMIEGIL